MPRNKQLYAALERYFGVGAVLIKDDGGSHEEYRVNCPFCSDAQSNKRRLYFHHTWGSYDPVTQRKITHLVRCFNENCVNPDIYDQATYDERMQNRELLTNMLRYNLGRVSIAAPTKFRASASTPLKWPGKVIRVDKLASKYPEHQVTLYLKKRGFDVNELGSRYGVVYCTEVFEPDHVFIRNTLLLPVWQGETLYSWVSRCPYDDIDGVPISKTKIKKYYNCAGRPLSRVCYNYDLIKCYSTVVLGEGIFDAMKIGDYGTCCFTKTLPETVKRLIVKSLMSYSNDEAAVVIMLDPDQDAKEKARGVIHHIERTASQFTEYIKNVIKIYLPSGLDPGAMTHDEITRVILNKAAEQGIELNLNRRREYDESIITRRLSGAAPPRR